MVKIHKSERMDVRKSLVFIFIVVFLFGLFILFQPQPQQVSQGSIYFEPLEISSAGNNAYVIYSANGTSKVTLLALKEKPFSNIYVLDSPTGIGISNLADFIYDLESLGDYGLTIKTITSLDSINEHSVLIIPQGSMPESAISLLDRDIVLIYIGKTNAFTSQSIIVYDWYSELSDNQKSNLIIYNHTLDELYLQEGVSGLLNSIVRNDWILESNKTYTFSEGIGTFTIELKDSNYLRIVYPTHEGDKILDSNKLKKINKTIDLSNAFPGEQKTFELIIDDPKGIPKLVVEKNGYKVSEEKLGSLGQTIFYKSVSYSSPGDYILRVSDYSGEVASGILHVYNLDIDYLYSDGFYYNFKIYLDGSPVDNEEATVHKLGSNNSLTLLVSDGILTVPAKLKKGVNTFVIEMYGQEFMVDVEYQGQGVFDVYFVYGPWGLALVVLIYIFVRLTKKQPYKIKFDSPTHLSSEEIKVSTKKINKLLPKAISEFGNSGCISPREFSMALKKYITDGYDVMDGNSESILKILERSGYLDSYKSFYKLKGKSDVRKIVIDRIIREKLIEHGIPFKYQKGFFKTKDYVIIFGKEPQKFRSKLIIVFDKQTAISNYLESLPKKVKAKIALKIRNGSLLLLTINELADYL